MDQPAQNVTQPASSQTPPVSNIPPSPKVPPPPVVKKPKIALLVAGIAAVLLICIAGFTILQQLPKKNVIPQPQPTTVPNADKLPSENLASARGEILNVNPQEKKLTLKSLNPRLDGIFATWTVTVTEETILARFSDWLESSSGESTRGAGFPKTDEEIKAGLVRIELAGFKVGDSVYLMAKQGQDLATMTEIEDPGALLLE
ncbi:MAG: hypothetical protein UY20_C0016G0002 [Candidatus Yanofskybacteria bacterium GW2011_GWA1_48_10]|uniref:Uncharacterized protein n=1 Tax=Candidatus Yanofskybacteria bacterium GW2011_GWA1_48_10 TaxID=1619022 RepID=A0A0G1U4X1_9BACT|nr:MAG: hypothetical protein UY20_C0016G0002 [Candidatus Yanofskybacteria bacterium GW2011_GWA1_48_10]